MLFNFLFSSSITAYGEVYPNRILMRCVFGISNFSIVAYGEVYLNRAIMCCTLGISISNGCV